MIYAYTTTNKIEVAPHFHAILIQCDKAERANDKKHSRCDRKHQNGKCPMSFQELKEKGLPEPANYTTGETVLIEHEEQTEHQELIRRMLSAIATLPLKRQDIIRCTYLDGETQKDYAARVGCSVAFVSRQRQIGLKQLYKLLV